MINSEGEHKLIGEASESFLTTQDDHYEVESGSEDSSADPSGVPTLGWWDVIITMDTEAISLNYSESHDLHDAKFKVTKNYGSITVVTILRNAEMALNDPHFGNCWQMAMENELENLHQAKHKFETILTIPEGREVMKGNWVYQTRADPHASEIIFYARWVPEGYTTIESTGYMNTYADMGLQTIDVEHEQSTFQGPSVHTPPGEGFRCMQCNKRKFLGSMMNVINK